MLEKGTRVIIDSNFTGAGILRGCTGKILMIHRNRLGEAGEPGRLPPYYVALDGGSHVNCHYDELTEVSA